VKYELRATRSFLIGRPVDGGTKPLRKHESALLCGLRGYAGGASVSSFTATRFEISLDNTGHFHVAGFVHEALTAIGKDCSHIGKTVRAHLARPKAGTHSHQLQ
jgi:hypothetical protein